MTAVPQASPAPALAARSGPRSGSSWCRRRSHRCRTSACRSGWSTRASPCPGRRTGRVRGRGSAAPRACDDDFGPAWSSRADLPDAREAGRRLITLTLEALAGRRPLAQLQPMTSPGVFAALSGGRRPRWCAEGTSPLIVGPVHVCEPVDGVAEVSAVARRGGRAHAVAARLEGIDGRWRCTALQVG